MTTEMGALSFRRRWPVVATAYCGVLVGAYIWWVLQPDRVRDWVLAASSTDLAHLERTPVRVLAASSLWSGHLIGYWLVVTVLSVGVLELVRGPVVTVVTGLVAHVLGTAVSEGIIALRIATGTLSMSARHLLDVGPSYIVASCAAAVVATPAAPRWLRVACALTLVPLVATAFGTSDAAQVATVGHTVAIAVGFAAAHIRRRTGSREPAVALT
jgi:hypothetical protein